MTDIKNQISSNETLLKSYNNQLRSKIRSKEREIEKLEELHDKRKIAIKSDFNTDLSKIKSDNAIKLHEEANSYNEKINDYKNNLEKISSQLNQTQKALSRENDQKLKLYKKELREQLDDQLNQTREETENLIVKSQEHNKNINAKTQYELSEIQKASANKIREYSEENNDRVLKNQNQFKEAEKIILSNHKRKLHETEYNLKKETEHKIKDLKKIDSELEKVNTAQIDFKKTFHQKQMEQIDKDFKTRYDEIAKQHNEMLANLSNRLEKDIEKLAIDNSKIKETFNDKSKDPFYHITELNPTISEGLKEYTVSLTVPEHEKANVFLSTQGRKLKITLSRKYDQMVTSDNGENRSTRSELFSKIMNLDHLLTNKNITQKYENGILSFTVQKA